MFGEAEQQRGICDSAYSQGNYFGQTSRAGQARQQFLTLSLWVTQRTLTTKKNSTFQIAAAGKLLNSHQVAGCKFWRKPPSVTVTDHRLCFVSREAAWGGLHRCILGVWVSALVFLISHHMKARALQNGHICVLCLFKAGRVIWSSVLFCLFLLDCLQDYRTGCLFRQT